MVLLLISVTAHSQEDVTVRDYDKMKIYHVPYGKKISTTQIELFPHYMSLRAQEGWRYAYIDLGYKLTNPIIVEEIPAEASRLVGRKPLGERVYIILEGKGYTEIRKDTDIAVKKIYWEKDDVFMVPYGYWVGHANPFEQPARFISWGVSFTNDLINPNIAIKNGRPKKPYVLNVQPYESQDSYGDQIKVSVSSNKSILPIKTRDGFVIYRISWGNSINLRKLKTSTPQIHKLEEEGSKSALLEMGGKVLSYFSVLDIAPQSLSGKGHKHGNEVILFGLGGKGTFSIKKDIDSSVTIISWEKGDLFCLPWNPDGTWHALQNSHDAPARVMVSVPILNENILLNPFVKRTRKIYRPKGGGFQNNVF